MPDADESPLRVESNTNDQTSKCPTVEYLLAEKTESTVLDEAKIPDAANGKASDSSEDPDEEDEYIAFDKWVESFKADPDGAWEEMVAKFDAMLAAEATLPEEYEEDAEVADKTPPTSRSTRITRSTTAARAARAARTTRTTTTKFQPLDPIGEELPKHEHGCDSCDCENPGLPPDYPKELLEWAKKMCPDES